MTENDVILVATADPEFLASWEHALEGFGDVLAVRKFDALKQACARVASRILLLDLDLPGLDGPRGVSAVTNGHPEARVIVLTRVVSDETEIALFKIGVRGCALRCIEPELLKRIVLAIDQGELWIRRSITLRLLDEVRARPRNTALNAYRESADRLTALTEREREIARLIGSGESNKQIARELYITERTVKAHVSGIFRKLGVADRVRLALRIAAHPEPEQERIN